jgi:hypothetical protein
MRRFALLEHTGAPDDPTGRHIDLLVEDGERCRTWRLSDVPHPVGPAVKAVEIAPHRLAWLDHLDGPVSGGRGRARRIEAGTCRLREKGQEAGKNENGQETAVEIELGSGATAIVLRLGGGTCAALQAPARPA